MTGSLEDLVNSFDEKLSKVFHDYQEKVEKIAPVQVSSPATSSMRCVSMQQHFSSGRFARRRRS